MANLKTRHELEMNELKNKYDKMLARETASFILRQHQQKKNCDRIVAKIRRESRKDQNLLTNEKESLKKQLLKLEYDRNEAHRKLIKANALLEQLNTKLHI